MPTKPFVLIARKNVSIITGFRAAPMTPPMFAGMTRRKNVAEKVTPVPTAIRLSIALSLLPCLAALTLATHAYGITGATSDQLAILTLWCRVSEAALEVVSTATSVGLLWLGMSLGAASPHDPAAAQLLSVLLLKLSDWLTTISATCFGVGSVIFSALLYRGRVVPRPLAAAGVIASIAVTVLLPLQLIGAIQGISWPVWLPMLVFEIVLGFRLLIKGAGSPGARPQPILNHQSSRENHHA